MQIIHSETSDGIIAYYSIFHAMRAVIALDGEDYKKHSAVTARFSEKYLKTDVLPREFGKLVSNASRIRNRSDDQILYADLFPKDLFFCNRSECNL